MFSLLQAQGASVRLLQHEEKAFLAWMRNTNNLFVGDEYQARLGIWLSNKRYVDEQNKKNNYRLAMNHLACYTPAEYKSLLGFKNVKSGAQVKAIKATKAAPESLDWRDSNIVNPIKDQAQCGSCWSFSTIQATESGWAKNKGTLYSLSEQNLVDCDTNDEGCNGGLMDNAWKYVIANQGGKFQLEDDYPYTGRDGTCKYDSSRAPEVRVVNDYQVDDNEDAVKEACAEIGVLAIAIDAGHISFQLYSSGIYDPVLCSSTNLDHAVGLVGYGTESGTDYWLVRNSWGTSWGEQGYIRMIRNSNNKCGVASMAFYPTFA